MQEKINEHLRPLGEMLRHYSAPFSYNAPKRKDYISSHILSFCRLSPYKILNGQNANNYNHQVNKTADSVTKISFDCLRIREFSLVFRIFNSNNEVNFYRSAFLDTPIANFTKYIPLSYRRNSFNCSSVHSQLSLSLTHARALEKTSKASICKNKLKICKYS